jgi:hypothetical protein
MTSKAPPIPPEQRGRRGAGASPEDHPADVSHHAADGNAHLNLKEQGRHGNIHQNLTHQGRQQDR